MKKTALLFGVLILTFVALIGVYNYSNSREEIVNEFGTVEGVVTDKSYRIVHTRAAREAYRFYITVEYPSLTLDNKPKTKTTEFEIPYENFTDINIGNTVVVENPTTVSPKIISYEKQSPQK